MSFNSTDYSKAPWAPGCMVLSHDECLFVIGKCEEIKELHPDRANDNDFIVGEYNLIDWKKAINGDTHNVLIQYGENLLGINENGIIVEDQETEEIPAE